VEPEPEPEPEPSPAPIIVDIVTPPKRDSRVEKIEEEKKEVKKDSHAYLRLSAPSKPKQISKYTLKRLRFSGKVTPCCHDRTAINSGVEIRLSLFDARFPGVCQLATFDLHPCVP